MADSCRIEPAGAVSSARTWRMIAALAELGPEAPPAVRSKVAVMAAAAVAGTLSASARRPTRRARSTRFADVTGSGA